MLSITAAILYVLGIKGDEEEKQQCQFCGITFIGVIPYDLCLKCGDEE
tara:strand:- start:87 stop:230 length:144 start_codon:yes stop_codon:yes gene_type:complete